jgi:hypothetical protein
VATIPTTTHEDTVCRRCPVRCDKVVLPAGCVEGECPRLYAHEQDGRTYVGCLDRVFAVEIDLEAFRRLEAMRPGFGALRAVRDPRPMCRTDVDRAFDHRARGVCVNPDFLLSATRHPLRVSADSDRNTA